MMKRSQPLSGCTTLIRHALRPLWLPAVRSGLATVLALLGVAPGHAASIELMPGASAIWIAKDISLGGIPASIEAVRHAEPIDRVIDFYRHAWERYAEVQIIGSGAQRIVSTRYRNRFISLQLESGPSGTDGILITSEEPGDDTAPDATLLLPPSAHLLSQQSHRDAGKLTETLTLHSERDAAMFSADLAIEWQAAGWQTVRDLPATRPDSGRQLTLVRGSERLDAYVARDRKWDNATLALVVWQRNGARQ